MMWKHKKVIFYLFCMLLIFASFVEFAIADKGRQYYEERGVILWDIQTEEKVIALTFDDGPHPEYTSQVLDLLKQYEAKATFFVVGENAEKNPEIIQRVYQESHELANHTYTHPLRPDISTLKQEIKQTNQLIFSLTGFEPILFRPVEGYYTDGMVEEVAKDGFKIVMWSWHQDTEDWKEPGEESIIRKVLEGTKPGDVVLFHDGGGDRHQTVEALDTILYELQERGYRFVTISELLEMHQK